jgi:hypothetical protein
MTTTTTPSEGQKEPTIVVDDHPNIIDSRSVPFESWSRLDSNPDALRIYFRTGFTRRHRRTRHRG